MNLLQEFGKKFNPYSIRHLALNWSESEQGIRHPDGPVGWVVRDQGQFHAYAGKCHSILSINGNFLNIATNYGIFAECINLTPKGINNFKILGRSINKKLHEGQKILAIKESITNLGLIGPETRVIVNGVIGEILNPVPLERIFEPKAIFEKDANQENLLPADIELFNLIDSAMRGI